MALWVESDRSHGTPSLHNLLRSSPQWGVSLYGLSFHVAGISSSSSRNKGSTCFPVFLVIGNFLQSTRDFATSAWATGHGMLSLAAAHLHMSCNPFFNRNVVFTGGVFDIFFIVIEWAPFRFFFLFNEFHIYTQKLITPYYIVLQDSC